LQKQGVTGAPTISCIIGDYKIDKALLDLGAEVNLLTYSVYLQLGLGELKPTPIILQLADRSPRNREESSKMLSSKSTISTSP